MNDYSETVLNNLKEKINHIHYNMAATGIFPNRNEPLKALDIGAENVLKTIFRFRVGFLEEFSILFSFCYSKQKFEALLLDLENQQYIKSQISKDYGKYFILTPKALYYLYTDGNTPFSQCKISEDQFPNEQKLIMHKCINGYFSNRIFQSLTNECWMEYQKMDAGFRKEYGKKQFIKQFLYSQTQKTAYSKSDAETFALDFLEKLDADTELTERYRRFVKYLKEHLDDTMLVFNFLKDFYNSLKNDRAEAIQKTIKELESIFNNVYRDEYFTYRDFLKRLSEDSVSLQLEHELFATNELLRVLQITRRNLLNSKKAAKEENELQTLLLNIESIEHKFEQLTRLKNSLEPKFGVMVFDEFSSNEIAVFKESNITLDTLTNMRIYITDCQKTAQGKYCLEFSIIQPTIEDISIGYLFKRIEAIYKTSRTFLLMFDCKIKIITYTVKQKEKLETRLKNLKEEFSLLPFEYHRLHLAIDDIEVVSTKQHLKERYETFKELAKYV